MHRLSIVLSGASTEFQEGGRRNFEKLRPFGTFFSLPLYENGYENGLIKIIMNLFM